MADVLIIALAAVLAVVVYILGAPGAGRRFPLKWRLTLIGIAVLTIAAAVWQEIDLRQEKRQHGETQAAVSVSFYNERFVRFNHGLKTRAPRITCLDPQGKAMYPGSITPLDENTVMLNMVTPLTGSCSAEAPKAEK